MIQRHFLLMVLFILGEFLCGVVFGVALCVMWHGLGQ